MAILLQCNTEIACTRSTIHHAPATPELMARPSRRRLVRNGSLLHRRKNNMELKMHLNVVAVLLSLGLVAAVVFGMV